MTTTYLFNQSHRTNTMSMQRQALSIIGAFFNKHKSLVGKPIFIVNPDKVVVQLFYFLSKNSDSLSHISICALGNALTRC